MKIARYCIGLLAVMLIAKKIQTTEYGDVWGEQVAGLYPDKPEMMPEEHAAQRSGNLGAVGLFFDLYTRNACNFTTGQRYVGLQTNNATVTPLDQSATALKLIRTIQHNVVPMRYGQHTATSLYGIPVTGTGMYIYSSPTATNEKPIGIYWEKQGIVQLETGQTYVAVRLDTIPHNPKIGPVWSWYTDQDFENLSKLFNLNVDQNNIQTMVEIIGYDPKWNKIVYGISYLPGAGAAGDAVKSPEFKNENTLMIAQTAITGTPTSDTDFMPSEKLARIR